MSSTRSHGKRAACRCRATIASLVWACIVAASGCSDSRSAPPDVEPYAAIDPALGHGDLTGFLEAYRRAYELPAMAAAVVDTAGVVAMGVAGERRAGSGVGVAGADAWHIGSSAKSMTATLVAILVEDGLLSWETTVGRAFPELQEQMDSGWRDVTIEQLLTHRGGAPASLVEGHPELWQRLVSREGSQTEQRRALVEAVTRGPPEGRPGESYAYSNAGYAIAGAMAETAAGTPWEELMRTRLFEPLGITSAGFGAPGDTARLDQPRGHDERGEPVEPGPAADNPPGIGPAGTVHLTIEDWARYARFHLRGAAGTAELLEPETFTRLHTSHAGGVPPYAMGWDVTDEAGPSVRVLAHSGSNTVWYSMIWMPLERGFGVLVVTNRGGERAREAVDQALWRLALHEFERR